MGTGGRWGTATARPRAARTGTITDMRTITVTAITITTTGMGTTVTGMGTTTTGPARTPTNIPTILPIGMAEKTTAKMFDPGARFRSQTHERIHAAYEFALTLSSFGAALLFVVGSVMFFFDAWQIPGTWCFLVGSVLFVVGPSLRFAREIHYLRLGEVDRLAKRVEDGDG